METSLLLFMLIESQRGERGIQNTGRRGTARQIRSDNGRGLEGVGARDKHDAWH